MRGRYLFPGLVFLIALAVGVAAAQSSSTNSQAEPSTQGQGSQVQSSPSGSSAPTQSPSSSSPMSPQSQTGSQAGSAPQSSSPNSSQTGPGAQGGSSPAAPQGQAPGPRSVEDELQLTDAQKAQLQPIIQEEMSQIEAVRNDSTLTMDQKVEKVRQIKQTEFPKIQAVLTPEQQKKLAEMQERARQQQGAAQGARGSSGQDSSQPPK